MCEYPHPRPSDLGSCAEVRAAIRSPLPSASPRSTVEQESPQGPHSSSDHQQPVHRQSSVSSLSPLSHLGREGSVGSQARLSRQDSLGSPGQQRGLGSHAKLGSQASLGSTQHLGSLQSRMSQQSALSHHAPLGSPSSHPQPLGQLQQLQQHQQQAQQQHRLLQQQAALGGSAQPLGHQTRAGSVDATMLRQQIGMGSPALVQQQARGHSLDPALLAQHGRGAFPPSSQQLYMGLLQRSHPPPPARDYQVHALNYDCSGCLSCLSWLMAQLAGLMAVYGCSLARPWCSMTLAWLGRCHGPDKLSAWPPSCQLHAVNAVCIVLILAPLFTGQASAAAGAGNGPPAHACRPYGPTKQVQTLASHLDHPSHAYQQTAAAAALWGSSQACTESLRDARAG